MIQLIKYTYIVFATIIFLRADKLDSDYSSDSQLIDLSVYDGQGSLLIHWVSPDYINVSQTTLFVKEFGEQEYRVLTTMLPEESKYLDYNCEPGVRYFYKVEIIDVFGEKFYSDISTPAFGKCLVFDEQMEFNEDVQSVKDLVLFHIDTQLKKLYPLEDLKNVTELINSTLGPKNNWMEKFPLDKLEYIGNYVTYIDNVINDIDLVEAIIAYDKLYRNHLFFIPSEWRIEIENTIENIRRDWGILYKEYPVALDDYHAIAPIRILAYRKVIDDESYLDLYFFHPNKILFNEVYLLSEEEYINLENYKLLESNFISIQIPNHWEYVDLMMDDIFIQTCPLVFSESVIFTIEGDIIPMESNVILNSDYPIRIECNKSSLWLNEITWNPYKKNIHIEIAGLPIISNNKYFIDNNNSVIWDIDNLSDYDIRFIDSSITIDEDIHLPTLISFYTIDDENHFNTLEYIFLDTIPFSISRVPDGNGWNSSEYHTMGKSNRALDDYSSVIVPEFFVLYQNYPNPFNGQTKISFDLFEDAIVNLYITDAKGRIHDKLIDKQFITSGIYNYSWDGEGRATGIYFITLYAEVNESQTAVYSRKMIYLK